LEDIFKIQFQKAKRFLRIVGYVTSTVRCLGLICGASGKLEGALAAKPGRLPAARQQGAPPLPAPGSRIPAPGASRTLPAQGQTPQPRACGPRPGGRLARQLWEAEPRCAGGWPGRCSQWGWGVGAPAREAAQRRGELESAQLLQSGSDAEAESSRRAPRPKQGAGALEHRGLRLSPLPVTSVRHLHGLLPLLRSTRSLPWAAQSTKLAGAYKSRTVRPATHTAGPLDGRQLLLCPNHRRDHVPPLGIQQAQRWVGRPRAPGRALRVSAQAPASLRRSRSAAWMPGLRSGTSLAPDSERSLGSDLKLAWPRTGVGRDNPTQHPTTIPIGTTAGHPRLT
jgi:hypothetical protein